MHKYYLKKTGIFSILFLADALFLYFLLLCSWIVRDGLLRIGILESTGTIPFHYFNQHYLPLVGFSLFVFLTQSLYFSRSSFFDEYKKIIKSALILILFWGFFVFALKLSDVYSRVLSFLFFVLIMFVFPLYRKHLKALLYRLRIWQKEVLIIGDCYPQNLKVILGDPILGYRAQFHEAKNLNEVKKILEQYSPGLSADLLFSFEKIRIRDLEGIVKKIEFNFETIKIFGGFSQLMRYILLVESNLPFNFFVVKRNLLKPYNRVIKRVFDFFVSLALGVLFLPLFVLVVLALLVFNRGKVFYVQERVGYRGRKFKMLKFRSMYDDSAEILEQFLKANPLKQAEWDRYRKFKKGDPRVTPFGRILRKFSFDELPQILNILKGEMSVCGPRPYLKDEIINNGTEMEILAYAKPGLTGLWQILGRNEVDFEHRILIDEYYIRNWDFWLDLFILTRTPFSMMKGY
ncbi:MAG TPA: hypothetical protein ENN40_03715 [Candidatus Aminicenantes bacterium]|nr:hypothetical protein [Candidatus Aminicenantes bacterium]